MIAYNDIHDRLMSNEVSICPPGLEITTEKECLEVWEANNAYNNSLLELPGLGDFRNFVDMMNHDGSWKIGTKREWMDVRLFLNGGNILELGWNLNGRNGYFGDTAYINGPTGNLGNASNWHEMEQNYLSANQPWTRVPFGCSYSAQPFMINSNHREPAFLFNNYEKTTKGLTNKGTSPLYYINKDQRWTIFRLPGKQKFFSMICKKGNNSQIYFE